MFIHKHLLTCSAMCLQAGNFLDKIVTFCVGMGIGEDHTSCCLTQHACAHARMRHMTAGGDLHPSWQLISALISCLCSILEGLGHDAGDTGCDAGAHHRGRGHRHRHSHPRQGRCRCATLLPALLSITTVQYKNIAVMQVFGRRIVSQGPLLWKSVSPLLQVMFAAD